MKRKEHKDAKDPPKNNQDTAKVILTLNGMCDVTNGLSKSDKKQCEESVSLSRIHITGKRGKNILEYLKTHFSSR